jgi:crotonobetainyl-CoA:carnitine CoA-transferase CaiB-like acyl-CoA transferase
MLFKALGGVKILEYCDTVSGAYCTKLMADLGAEVIKIETPGIGDGARREPPFPNDIPHPEKSGLFLYVNTNKYGITLNPANPLGKDIFKKLVQEVDILIEDKPPGAMDKMGLGYEDLKKLNPGLIMTSITPFGRSGPYKDYKAYQLNISHVSGQGNLLPIGAMDLERPPVKVGGNSGYFDPGLVASVAVMAALFWKGKTGQGQFIEMSMQEALMSMQRVESVTFPNNGMNMTRILTARHRAHGGVMPCKDGYVVVITPEEHQWEGFMKLMGDPEWSKEEWCKDRVTRAEHVDKFQESILEWMRARSKEEIFRNGQALSVPIAPVNSSQDIVESPQFNARNFFVEMEHPKVGKIEKFPSSPYRFSKTPWKIERPAPLLGEHNEMIYCERLGYTKEDLVQFKESEII